MEICQQVIPVWLVGFCYRTLAIKSFVLLTSNWFGIFVTYFLFGHHLSTVIQLAQVIPYEMYINYELHLSDNLLGVICYELYRNIIFFVGELN
jgi:hypothetical protein